MKIIVYLGLCIMAALLFLPALTAGSQGDDNSYFPYISTGNGRYVTYESDATNLVTSDTNGRRDIFVRDRQAGVTYLVSKSSAGVQGNGASMNPTISSDGQYVAFFSYADTFVSDDLNGGCDIFVRDRQTGTTTLVSKS
jgi:Tol biopolymer transport system component